MIQAISTIKSIITIWNNSMGGDYLARIRVITKLCMVQIVTMSMTVSMKVFTGYRAE